MCNGTQNLVGVAIGYRAKEGWISEGWWQVPATTCATLIEGELQSRYYYLYAEDAARGGRWTGDVNMCVAENEFKVTGVEDCFARGFQRMGFKEYDTGRQGSWMVQLSDTPGTQESQN
ncbi:UNVERIFIED_ORG: putative membrane protein [Shinella zoogloeoides]|nr:putative membrane protein [Shinella zoogloeoides]